MYPDILKTHVHNDSLTLSALIDMQAICKPGILLADVVHSLGWRQKMYVACIQKIPDAYHHLGSVQRILLSMIY